MSNIVQFRAVERTDKTPSREGAAEIVIFPGIRVTYHEGASPKRQKNVAEAQVRH